MKKFTLLVFIVLITLFSYAGHFVPAFTGNGVDQMTINVLTASLSGVDLEAGDEIAVFDGSVCCGTTILTEPLIVSNFVSISASRSDATPQNGYIVGHTIMYRFWDKSANKAISGISTEYLDFGETISSSTFIVGESTFVKLSCANPINLIPVSKAGSDQTVGKSSFVTLDGSASSDEDTDPLTYLWNVPAGIILSSTNVAKPTFTAPIVVTETNYTFSLIVNDGMDNSNTDEVIITVKPSVAPTASAGSNQTVNELALVTLNGTASDPDAGDVLTYKWTGPSAIKLSSTTVLNPTFTAPEVWDFSVDYTLSLVANDGTVDSPVSTVVITVKNVNKAPIADAGPDQSLNEGLLVTLDASKSRDTDFDDITYKWTAPEGITLSSTTVAKPTFTAPEVNADKAYTFSLVVNDKKLDSPEDQVVVTVKNINKVPVANAGVNQSVNENVTVTLDGSASSDDEGGTLTYLWTAPAEITTLSSTTEAKPTFTAPEVTVDTDYTFSLVVNDGTDNSIADQVVVTVKQVNKVPVANAGEDKSADEGSYVTLYQSSSDPDGDHLTYKWTAPAGITLDSDTDVKPSFTAPEVTADKDFAITLVVNDGKVDSPADQVIITIKQVNKAPVANAGPDQSPNELTVVTLDGLLSSDLDNDALTYAWTAPSGIILDLTIPSKPTFVAPEVTSDTPYTFSLIVNDGKLNSIVADEVMITVKQVNKAPVANAGTAKQATEKKTVELDGSLSSDFENDALTYSWTAPAGITLSSSTTAKPTFTAPAVVINTDYTFSLVVNDGALNSPSVNVVITIIPNRAPVANAGPAQTQSQKTVVTLDGSGSTDPDSDVLTYLWTVPAGSGITLSDATAQKPTFTAPDVAVNTLYTFSLVVKDGVLNSPSVDVIITVIPNRIPVANAGTAQSVNENTLVTLDGSASADGDVGDVLTYKWTAPAGSGITFNDDTAQKPTFTTPEVMTDTDFAISLVVRDGKDDSPAATVVVTVKQVNKAPVANAGADKEVTEKKLFELDGSLSSDFDGDALTYLWTAPAGITLSDATAQKPTFTAPAFAVSNDYSFSLVVNDGKVNSTANEVIIKVIPNKIPLAKAGPDQSVNEGTLLVTLDGSGSTDPDSDGLTYKWTAPAEITLSSTTAQNPTFTAPEVFATKDFTISLVVNDGALNSIADQVVINVKQVNKAPVANAGTAKEATERKVVQLDGSLSADPDNDVVLTYLWTAPVGITLSSTTVAKPTFTAPVVADNTDYTFSLVVNDGVLSSPSVNVVITVIPNKAPLANAGPDQTVAQNQTVTLNGSLSSDPENDQLTYIWDVPAGITLINPNSATPSFIAPMVLADTDYLIKLKVNDDELDSPENEVIIRVLFNRIPVANAGEDFDTAEGSIRSLNGSASSDPDNDALTYLWTAPEGITLSSSTTAMPTFFAPEVTVNKTFTFSLVVNDGMVNSIADQVVVRVIQLNKAPLANAGTDQTINEGVTATLDGTASSDFENDVLTYLWTAPAGITLNSNTAAHPTFTAPEVAVNTEFIFTLVVNDGFLNSIADQVVVTVNQVNKAPLANAGSDQTINEGATATLDGSASSDFENKALTYLWTAPEGITLSSLTEAMPTFTAPEVAVNTDFNFTLVVNDGFLNSEPVQVVITVNQVNKAPIAIAGTNQTINEGMTATLDGSASSDFENDALTYLWTAPEGITLSSLTEALPTFTAPEVAINTDFIFTLVVNDGFLNSEPVQVVITVNQVNKAPIAIVATNQTIDEGMTATLDGSASSDFENDALTYLWTAPEGLTLSSLTEAMPTFTAPEVTENTDFTFSLVVSDGFLNSEPVQVVITVNQVNKAPIAIAGTNQTINEGLTATLDGSASSDFENDALTYLWTAPVGIILSSLTEAKPTFTAPEVAVNTDFNFSLVVSDGLLSSEPSQVTVSVNQINITPVSNAGSDQSVNENSLCTLDGTASSDFDQDVLTYLWTAPVGITLSSYTVAKPIFTAPEVQSDKNFTFTLVVSDGIENSQVDAVTISVKQVNIAPVADAGSDQSIKENILYTLNGSSSSDFDNNVLTYKWTSPAGIDLSSKTIANPSFIAPEVDTDTDFIFSLVVNDGTVSSIADQVVITVLKEIKAPVYTGAKSFIVNEDESFELSLTWTEEDANNTKVAVDNLPEGILVKSIASNSATIGGLFSNDEVGDHYFTLLLSNGKLTSAESIKLTVLNTDDSPYVKNAIKDVSVDKGSPDQIIDLKTVFADDDLGDVLTYSISSNTNDNVVNGKITGSELTLSFSTLNIGLSEIVVTASSNGKVATSKFKIEVKIPVGIDLLTVDTDVQVYPNPTKGDVQLKFNQMPKAGIWITVYDLSGRVIYKGLADEKEEKLNLKGNPAGLYFIKVDQKNSRTYKIVLE